jgi:hypothetical protein
VEQIVYRQRNVVLRACTMTLSMALCMPILVEKSQSFSGKRIQVGAVNSVRCLMFASIGQKLFIACQNDLGAKAGQFAATSAPAADFFAATARGGKCFDALQPVGNHRVIQQDA